MYRKLRATISGLHRQLRSRIAVKRTRREAGRLSGRKRMPVGKLLIVSAIVIGIGLVSIWKLTARGVLVWDFERLRPYVIAIIAGLGALLVAVAGMVSQRRVARWILVVAGSVAVAWATLDQAISLETKATKLQKELETKTMEIAALGKRFRLLGQDLRSYMGKLPASEQMLVLKAAAGILANRFGEALREKWTAATFDSSKDVIGFILDLDKNNGHALYFSGEIKRKLGHPEKGHQELYLYIEREKELLPESREGGTEVAACRRPSGYCRQRTAWIHHLLANDFYADGLKSKASKPGDTGKIVVAFETALVHACAVLSLYRGGFVDPDQIRPTRELEEKIRIELGALGRQPGECPTDQV